MFPQLRSQPHFSQIQRELEQVFQSPRGASPLSFLPAVDIEETETSFLIQADVPGMNEETIEIVVDGNELILSGSRAQDTTDEKRGSRLKERAFGKFKRSFRLGSHIDQEHIVASYKNGVLTIDMPKSSSSKARQIPVTVH